MTAKPTFFEIRNAIMSWENLSLSTRVLWEHLCQMAWSDGSCYPSNNTLSKILGISPRQIVESKNELTKKRLINVFHRNRPQTTIIFPFVQFKNIEQRDKNITPFNSAVNALPETIKNNNLQVDSADNAFGWCSECTTNSAVAAPIKENIKIKLKEDKNNTTNVVFCQTCPETDIFDTENSPNNHQPKLSKQQRSEAHKTLRQQQITEIETNIQRYRDEYPAVNVDLQFKKMKLWLETNQKGKVRKDIHRTWLNWLLKAQSNYNVAQLGRQTPESKKISQLEEMKKYAEKYSR